MSLRPAGLRVGWAPSTLPPSMKFTTLTFSGQSLEAGSSFSSLGGHAHHAAAEDSSSLSSTKLCLHPTHPRPAFSTHSHVLSVPEDGKDVPGVGPAVPLGSGMS